MKKYIPHIFGLALALLASPLAQAQNYIWNEPTGDLLDGANWIPTVPGTFNPTSADVAAISNGGTATLSGGSITLSEFYIGNNATGIRTGTFEQTGGSITTSNFVVGRQGTAVGTYHFTGGTLTTTNFRVGAAAAAAVGTATVSGSGTQLLSSGFSGVGINGTGTLTLENGALWKSTGGNIVVGGDNNVSGGAGGIGTLYVLSGAQFDASESSGNLAIGRNPGGNGTVVVDGGSITLGTGNINLTPQNGSTSSGDRTGTLTLNSGSITTLAITAQYGESTINLNGGTLTVGSVSKWSTATGAIHFNGTQIVAIAPTEDFFAGYAGNGDLDVQAGGLKIDTFDSDVAFTQAISGVGALVKSGGGILTLSGASTYAGGTTISGGTLLVAEGGLLGSGDIVVASGGILDFDGDFTLTTAGLVLQNGGVLVLDRDLAFAEVTIGGVSLEEGVYDYATLKANYADFFADGGSGQIAVGVIPEPPVLVLLGAGFVAGVCLRARRAGV